MLVMNQRLNQLAAAYSDFTKWGMLDGLVLPNLFQSCEFLTSPCGCLSDNEVICSDDNF
jgi:hypothetical protein